VRSGWAARRLCSFVAAVLECLHVITLQFTSWAVPCCCTYVRQMCSHACSGAVMLGCAVTQPSHCWVTCMWKGTTVLGCAVVTVRKVFLRWQQVVLGSVASSCCTEVLPCKQHTPHADDTLPTAQLVELHAEYIHPHTRVHA
jgi:hypothetical protein